MLKLVIEKELRDSIGSAKFAVTFGVCSVLLLLSFYAGARNYRTGLAQHEAAKRENLRQMEGLTDWFSVQQTRIFLPPQPLAAIVSGISNDIGRTTEVHGRGELTAEDSRFGEDPIFAVFRFLDLEFMFQIVLSLLAIVFAYDAVAGEKERGTLRLTFAHPVPRDTFILGKLIGSFLGLAVPLLVPILIGCAILPLAGVPMAPDDWVRLTVVIGAGLLCMGIFLSLSVFVSATTQRASTSFLMLLTVWILSVLIIPRASVLLAGRAVDVPSVDDLTSQKQRLSAQLWSEDRKQMAAFKPTEKQPDKIMEEFNKMMQSLADERERKMNEFAARLNEDRANRQAVQARVAFGIARLSPASVLSLAVTALAGTSPELQQRYKDEATTYQQSFAAFIKQKTGMVPGGRMMVMRNISDEKEKPKPIDVTELPEFRYVPPGFRDVAGAALPDLGLLVFFNLVFFAGGYGAFMRYDVR